MTTTNRALLLNYCKTIFRSPGGLQPLCKNVCTLTVKIFCSKHFIISTRSRDADNNSFQLAFLNKIVSPPNRYNPASHVNKALRNATTNTKKCKERMQRNAAF